MGRAIHKSVTIVEFIKRSIVGLHQITAIQSTDITDTWEPLEEGLQIIETTRKVSMVTITLSKKELEKTNIGYQPPIPADQVKVPTELEYDGGGSPVARGRGRGGRGRVGPRPPSGNNFTSAEFEDGGYEQDHGYASSRGRGRGGNFRGRVRGGYYSGPRFDTQRDSTNGYNQQAPRGRGRRKIGDPVEEVEHLIRTVYNDWSYSMYHHRYGVEERTVDDFRYAAGKTPDLYSRVKIPRIFEIHDTTSHPIEEFEKDLKEEGPKLEMVDSDDEDIISWTEPPPPIPVIEILSSDDEE
ncbi:hypothetical protein OROHE_023545 [Orobanche hederae]